MYTHSLTFQKNVPVDIGTIVIKRSTIFSKWLIKYCFIKVVNFFYEQKVTYLLKNIENFFYAFWEPYLPYHKKMLTV